MELPEVLGEEEIELNLGLSIGGRNSKKFEKKSNHVDQKSISSITFDLQLFENDTESRMKNDDYSSPSCVCSLSVDDEGECEAVLDPEKMRREIHRMRRQEARKKQLQKRNGRKDFDLMVRNEDEDGSEQQICKKLKSEEDDDDVVVGEEKEQNLNQSISKMPMQYGFQSMQYVPFGNGFAFPYHHHHLMQSWIPPASSSDRDDNRSFKPIQFENSVLNREGQVKNCDFEQNVSRCGGDKAATTTRSSGSAGSSSSAVSDYGNGSQHGGSSCETRSHSSQSPPPEQPQSNVPVMSNVQVQSEFNTSSNPAKSILVFGKTNTNANNIVCSNDAQSNPSKTEEKQVPVIDPHPIDKPNTVTDYSLPAFLRPDQHLKGDNVENFKPPKLQPPRQLNRTNEEGSKPLTSEPPHQPTGTNGEGNLVAPKLTQPSRLLKRTNEEASKPFIPKPPHQLTETNGESNLITPKLTQPQTESLPRMPCVSTVGKGPNGKTVTGFLYRYTKTEVSIICVCHGSSFSPAEFVKHAGGTDVSHPLKDIVVVP